MYKGQDIYIEFIDELADEIVDYLDSSDEFESVAIVGKYEEISNLLSELMIYGVMPGTIELYSPDSYDYDDEYRLVVFSDTQTISVDCCKLKADGVYKNVFEETIYVFDNCSSWVLPYCNANNLYYVSIDEFEDDEFEDDENICDQSTNEATLKLTAYGLNEILNEIHKSAKRMEQIFWW